MGEAVRVARPRVWVTLAETIRDWLPRVAYVTERDAGLQWDAACGGERAVRALPSRGEGNAPEMTYANVCTTYSVLTTRDEVGLGAAQRAMGNAAACGTSSHTAIAAAFTSFIGWPSDGGCSVMIGFPLAEA